MYRIFSWKDFNLVVGLKCIRPDSYEYFKAKYDKYRIFIWNEEKKLVIFDNEGWKWVV